MYGEDTRARTRRDLSQHFLRSRSLAARLVAQSSISKDDLVVEIGPGRGILTRELARRCSRLIAVEKDRGLLSELVREFEHQSRVELVEGDFLRFSLPKVDYKVFSNIPFSRTAAIIRRLVQATRPPSEAHLIVQREAGERFAGCPYAQETLTSLLIKPWWHVEIIERLRRIDFEPVPSVDPIVLWLAHRPMPLVPNLESKLYRQFIEGSFGRRGRTVRQCLNQALTHRQLRRLARDLRFDLADTPSALHFDQWLGIYRFFSTVVRQAKPMRM